MEQLCFDSLVSDERRAFELVYPHLCDIIYNAPIDTEVLLFREINDCSSVYFMSTNMLLFQIRFRKKSKYLLLPERCVDDLQGVTGTRAKSDPGMVRIPMESPDDILVYIPALRNILRAASKRNQSFGCCSRYEACSDAKTCIHPDVKFALGCQYRHNLMEGKIFYGKNKTID